ncbi:MAG: hypothetical protein GYB68_15560 [Chloroflexi bacterium]|nr:hypothetical protein [Chloroflexota bacterium]
MAPQYIWNTDGDWIATRIDDHIWDLTGTWVAWLDGDEVFTVDGEWVGRLHKDGRILRKRAAVQRHLRDDIPPYPEKPDLPARSPLPPMFIELDYSTIDVLEEDPDVFRHISDKRPDMD